MKSGESDATLAKRSKSKTPAECVEIIDGKRYFKRISLKDTFKRAWHAGGIIGVLEWCIASVELQEPTYSRLVLLYRSLPEGLLQEKLRRAKEASHALSSSVKKRLKPFTATMDGVTKRAISTTANFHSHPILG